MDWTSSMRNNIYGAGEATSPSYDSAERGFAYLLLQARESGDVELWHTTMMQVMSRYGAVEGVMWRLAELVPEAR